MENNYRIRKMDFVPIRGLINYLDRNSTTIRNETIDKISESPREEFQKLAGPLFGLVIYNGLILSLATSTSL
jgi:hypothetical protein